MRNCDRDGGVILRAASSLLLLTLAGASFPDQAHAQIPNDEFSTNRFSPAPGSGNYVMVDGAGIGGHFTPTLGLFVDYAHRPFVLFTATCPGGDADECDVEDAEVEIVAYQLTFNPMATLTLWQRLQLGLVVPVIATDGDSFSARTPGNAQSFVDIRGGSAFGMGDPRLSAKVSLLGGGSEGFSLAAVGFLALPLGHATAEGSNLGDESFSGGGHLAAELRLGRISVAANAGGVIRPERQLLSTEMGPELTYGVGAGLELTPLLRLIGEVTGATQLTSQQDENPIEARVAGELTQGDLAVLLGGGVGLLSGVGVPDFRVFAGVAYRPAGVDTDRDGIRDKEDSCPSEPEDEDGYLDNDGCPEADNDNDGLLDGSDKCPDVAEDADGNKDEDGCPELDNDGDGVQDGYDSCPNDPEDKDGDRDEDGCPDDDRDRDGVPDGSDKCPENPEDTDGFGDDDGCPETDFDGDGVPDDEDQCPDQPENLDGIGDTDGCPEAATPPPPPTAVKVTCEKIEFPGNVYFKTNSDVIQARSHELLTQIADALKGAPHVKKIEVGGHTDSSGRDDKNLELSERRAASVARFLVTAGIDETRLQSKGYGETRPIADNKTKAGRDANRRVEFLIVEQDTKGCKK